MSHYRTDDITFCSHDKCSHKTCSRNLCNRINKDLPYSVADYKDTKLCPIVYGGIDFDEYVPLCGTGRYGFDARQKEMQYMRDNGFTLNEIGEKYGISRQRVYQILNKKKVRVRK